MTDHSLLAPGFPGAWLTMGYALPKILLLSSTPIPWLLHKTTNHTP